MAHDTILFVSMDGSSTKSSAIRAHAARKGHQKSREKALNRSTSQDNDQQPQETTKPKPRRRNNPSAPNAPPFLKPRARKSQKTETQSGSTSSKDSNSNEDSPEQSRQQLVPARRQSESPYQIWIPACMSDRFVSMFFETMLPSYTAAYDVFNVPNIIMQEWPLYMNHEVFLWTEAAAIQGLYENLQRPTEPPSQKVLLYKAKALSCLKQELLRGDGKLDDYLIMSIFVLASLDLMAGDDIAHNAHKKMLRTAFATAGGLHTYGSFVRNTTMRLDSFWRSTADEPTTPAVPKLQPSRAPRLPSHPFSAEICTLIGSLPEGFQELALKRKLPLDVLEVLGRLADPNQKPLPMSPANSDNRSPITSSHSSTNISSSSSTSSSSTSSNSGECVSGMYLDFWESCPSLDSRPSPTSSGEPRLERLLSLALLIYATNRDAANPLRMYNCITNGAIYDLCHDLPLCETQRDKDDEHCLYWIWSVAVDATRDRHGNLSPAGQSLLEAQKERFPGFVGTRGEEAVLRRFWFKKAKSPVLQPLQSSHAIMATAGQPTQYISGSASVAGSQKAHSTAARNPAVGEDPGSPGSSWQVQSSMEESASSFSVQTPRTDIEGYGGGYGYGPADYVSVGMGGVGWSMNVGDKGQWGGSAQSDYGYGYGYGGGNMMAQGQGGYYAGSVSGKSLGRVVEEQDTGVPELPFGERKAGRQGTGVIRAVVG